MRLPFSASPVYGLRLHNYSIEDFDMDSFMAGILAGVLLERYHLIHEGNMADFLYIVLTIAGFGFMAWAVHMLKE